MPTLLAHHMASLSVDMGLMDQELIRKEMEVECDDLLMRSQLQALSVSAVNDSAYCDVIWDGITCWNRTQAGVTATQPCPGYIYKFNQQETASKICTRVGKWFVNDVNVTWTNYSLCEADGDTLTLTAPIPGYSLLQRWIPVLKAMSQVGYGVSFVTLIVALCVLSSIRKLRCPRNQLHKHLFLSFIMRALMALLKDALFVEGVGLPSDVTVHKDGAITFNKEGSNWLCKCITSLWHYFIMANYSWIFMEGLYLHNLIFQALFSDTSAITMYVVLGWGIPAVLMSLWVTTRAHFEDEYCWTTNDTNLFLLIRIPVAVSVFVSFLLFVNIVRVLLVKLQGSAHMQRRRARFRKLARSTLVLVPLFGVHYAVLLGMSYSIKRYPRVELAWLFCDQFFASFQGMFVSLLYCLLNAEVRGELARKWRSWQRERGLQARAGRGGSLTSGPDTLIRMSAVGRDADHRVHTISGSEDERTKLRNDLHSYL